VVGAADLACDLRDARAEPGRRGGLLHDRPEGDRAHGWWRITSVEPPTSLEFTDGFANEDGTPKDDHPVMTVRVRLSERDGGTRMEMSSRFESREDMDRLVEMGIVEGLRGAVGQMDALLAE
jgi:uncharacterized protein YndB with AHSA1/START domain